MGWGDFKTTNTTTCGAADATGTPCLQKLASEGITLTNYYTPTPLCTPSRAALMTGRDPRRISGLAVAPNNGILSAVTSYNYLPTSETTMAEVLKLIGYNTAIIGKWNLGWGGKGSGLNSWDQGFEYNYVLPLGIGQGHKGFCLVTKPTATTRASWSYIKDVLTYGYEQHSDPSWKPTGDEITITDCATATTIPLLNPTFAEFAANTSLTQKLTDKAKNYIDNLDNVRGATITKPFFLYLAYPAPHTPLYIHLLQDESVNGHLTPYAAHKYCKDTVCADVTTCTTLCVKDNLNKLDKCADDQVFCTERCANDCKTDCVQNCEIDKLYPYVIREIDRNVGQMLDKLGDINDPRTITSNPATTKLLKDTTIVIFTSDNGPFMGQAAEYNNAYYSVRNQSTGGFRGGKKFTYEGGVRVPFIARWPNKWADIGAPLSQLADMKDLFPTLVNVALRERESDECIIDTATGITDCVKNGTDANDTTLIRFTGMDGKLYNIAVDGKNIEPVLLKNNSNKQIDKNIQISWFGNFPVCVGWNADGSCVDSQPSHPFAINSNVTDNVGPDVSDYKLYFTKDSYGIYDLYKPTELYNIKNNRSEDESNGNCLCFLNLQTKCEAFCEPANRTCKSGDLNWDTQYKLLVEALWNRANLYQYNVKKNYCQGSNFINSDCAKPVQ